MVFFHGRLQFATFAPIFRTHCQLEPIPQANICDPRKDPHCQGCERRIWKFVHYEMMKDAMVLRNGLAPCAHSPTVPSTALSPWCLHRIARRRTRQS